MIYMYYLVLKSVAKKYISVIWQAQIHSILPFNPYYEIFISFLTKVMNREDSYNTFPAYFDQLRH